MNCYPYDRGILNNVNLGVPDVAVKDVWTTGRLLFFSMRRAENIDAIHTIPIVELKCEGGGFFNGTLEVP